MEDIINNETLSQIIKDIQMYKTSSSNVSSIGYNEENKILKVIFSGGGSYVYFGIPKFVWTELCEAQSKGKYLQENITRNKTIKYIKLN